MPVSKLRKNHKQALAKRNKAKIDEQIRKMKFYQSAFAPPKKATIDLDHVDMEFPEGDPLLGADAVTAILDDLRKTKEGLQDFATDLRSDDLEQIDVNLQSEIKDAL